MAGDCALGARDVSKVFLSWLLTRSLQLAHSVTKACAQGQRGFLARPVDPRTSAGLVSSAPIHSSP